MIKIRIEESALQKAQEEHLSAVIAFVKSQSDMYQKTLFTKIAQIIESDDTFELLKANNDWTWLKLFILANINHLRKWVKEKSNLLEFDEFLLLYKTKFCNGDSQYVSDKYNAYTFLNNIGVKVCPYCEEEYLDLLKKDDNKHVRTLDIDHFFPKSMYQGLAMCFYNLIPSGKICNGIKLTKDLGMSPYDVDIEEHTHLAVDLPVGINMDDISSDQCKVMFHATGDMVTNVELLLLEQRYENHKGLAHRYLTLMQQYPPERIRMAVEQGWYKNTEQAYRILFGETLEKTGNKPVLLQKLKRDILGSEIMIHIE